MEFGKYEGLGNDFIIIDARTIGADHPAVSAAMARRLCDRRRGIGGDGVLILGRDHARATWRMDILNADGSVAGMCGNGLRCVLAYCWRQGILAAEEHETTFLVGDREYPCARIGGHEFRVDMGIATRQHSSLPSVSAGESTVALNVSTDTSFTGVPLWLGNPHFVIFAQDGLETEALRTLALQHGPALEAHAAFPDRANISFVSMALGRSGSGVVVNAVVFERGVGITEACGSGACAIGLSAVHLEKAARHAPIQVRLPGGVLAITIDAQDHMIMQGEARHVFSGVWPVP